MSESFTTQDNDYLSSHHTQTSAHQDSAGVTSATVTPQFLATENAQAMRMDTDSVEHSACEDAPTRLDNASPNDSAHSNFVDDSSRNCCKSAAASAPTCTSNNASKCVPPTSRSGAIQQATATESSAASECVAMPQQAVGSATRLAPLSSTSTMPSPSLSTLRLRHSLSPLSAVDNTKTPELPMRSAPSISSPSLNLLPRIPRSFSPCTAATSPSTSIASSSSPSLASSHNFNSACTPIIPHPAYISMGAGRGTKRRGSDSSLFSMSIKELALRTRKIYRPETAFPTTGATGATATAIAIAASPSPQSVLSHRTAALAAAADRQSLMASATPQSASPSTMLESPPPEHPSTALPSTPSIIVSQESGSVRGFSGPRANASKRHVRLPLASVQSAPQPTQYMQSESNNNSDGKRKAQSQGTATGDRVSRSSSDSTAESARQGQAVPTSTAMSANKAPSLCGPRLDSQSQTSVCGDGGSALPTALSSSQTRRGCTQSDTKPNQGPLAGNKANDEAQQKQLQLQQQQQLLLQQLQQQQQQQQQQQNYPPINRYTLRELKIQSILQNPRLRHEIMFEPKLEFRPNVDGQMAEGKRKATQAYWDSVRRDLAGWTLVGDGLQQQRPSNPMTLVVLLVEISEILIEMAEDSPSPEHADWAAELRASIDEQLIVQQIEHNVFNPIPVCKYLLSMMQRFAQKSGQAHVDKLWEYIREGDLIKTLRKTFDTLEIFKIEAANRYIEMYREYMRATAVTFEWSNFSMQLKRKAFALNSTVEWWNRMFAQLQDRCTSTEDMFNESFCELVLDDGLQIPDIFHMDERRINTIRRECERLASVAFISMSYVQFVSYMIRKYPQVASVSGAKNGQVDFERLSAECLRLIPEGSTVIWTHPILSTGFDAVAAASQNGMAQLGSCVQGNVNPGNGQLTEIHFTALLGSLAGLFESSFSHSLSIDDAKLLARLLMSTASYSSSVREVVEERLSNAFRIHFRSLCKSGGKKKGTQFEEMPDEAKELLQKAKVSFLIPSITALVTKAHGVSSHHLQVYKPLYDAVTKRAAKESV